VEAAQLALSLVGKGWDAGNDGTSKVHNSSLDQVKDNTNGTAEERVGNEAVGANKSVDEPSVGISELL
jgi:hypothetical protein